MTTPRISQLTLVAPLLADPPNIRVMQYAVVTVLQQAPPTVQMSQLAIVSVCGNGLNRLTLEKVVGLSCWQPCTAFGTEGTIYYVNST